jgi:hypothetical protein
MTLCCASGESDENAPFPCAVIDAANAAIAP